MTDLEIVRSFVELGSKAQMVAATREFNLTRAGLAEWLRSD